MKESEIHLLLGVLIHGLIQLEGDGWAPISILHRVITEGNITRSGQAGHQVLCHDLPIGAKKVQPGFNALDLPEKIIVITKHMPRPEGAKRWQDLDKARYLSSSLRDFNAHYRRALRAVKKTVARGR